MAPEDDYEFSKGKPYSLAEAGPIIALSQPRLEVDSLEFIGHGMASCAYLVNHRYVFRLPKNKEASESLSREVCLLPQLKQHIQISIPDIEFIIPESSTFGKVGVGYKAIEGEPLSESCWQALKAEQRQLLVQDFARFLCDLHSFPVESTSCALKTEHSKQTYSKYQNYFQEKLFPYLSKAEQKTVDNLFDQYLSDEENFRYQPSLVHGDISPDHILIDPVSGHLRGIIDFGDLKIADPDWDLIYLHEDFDKDFADRLLACKVTTTEPARLLVKVSLFKMCVLTAFIEDGQKESNKTKLNMGWRFLRENISACTSFTN